MTTNTLYEICRKAFNDYDGPAFYNLYDTKHYTSYTDAIEKAFELGMQNKGFEFVVFPVGDLKNDFVS